MRLEQSKYANPNYLAKIVELKDFSTHPNPKCERLKCCTIDGYNIAVSIDTNPGTYIYFPIETQITPSYLATNNLFRDKEYNVDKSKGGFFESAGRVKIIKLQGYPSEGFVMPIDSLYLWLYKLGITEHVSNLKIGTEFDTVGEHRLCWKYTIPKQKLNNTGRSKQGKQPKGLNKLIENQFRFHYDTVLLKKCPYVISPNDIIQISEKVHGTSAISALVNCKCKLSWKDRIAKWLTKRDITGYSDIYASRTVVKNKYINEKVSEGFYGVDIWGIAHKIILPKLTKGLTVYYEIIGYLPSGAYIQKEYDYNYECPKTEEYIYNKHYGIRVYRITYTNIDGIVYEFSARQVQQWCTKVGLNSVREWYYGYAKDLYPELDVRNHWHENFLYNLCNDKRFYMEELSPSCVNRVPHEGIVLRIENGLSEAYKVKCIKFLEKESKQLDSGENNIEDDN